MNHWSFVAPRNGTITRWYLSLGRDSSTLLSDMTPRLVVTKDQKYTVDLSDGTGTESPWRDAGKPVRLERHNLLSPDLQFVALLREQNPLSGRVTLYPIALHREEAPSCSPTNTSKS